MNEKAHAAGKRTGGVGFLCIWLFCQIIRSFRNQPVKVALIGSILQNSELFKLFLSKGWVTNLTLYLYALIPAIPTVLAVATFILVVTFSRRIEKMSVASAQALFMGYSVLMGITLSS